MSSAVASVVPGSFLSLHYRLSGAAGVVVSTFEGSPATLTLGSGQLSPALEQALIGLSEGSHSVINLPAGAAFGKRSANLLQWMARQELQELGVADEEYTVGEVLKFPTPDGEGQFAGVILELNENAVLLDFNHPLADQPVQFEVQLIGVL